MIQQTALGELVKGLSIRQAKCQGQAHVLICIKHYTQTKKILKTQVTLIASPGRLRRGADQYLG